MSLIFILALAIIFKIYLILRLMVSCLFFLLLRALNEGFLLLLLLLGVIIGAIGVVLTGAGSAKIELVIIPILLIQNIQIFHSKNTIKISNYSLKIIFLYFGLVVT
jgi:hypothetical protein